ncbi:envelope stress response membrane protein PspC [Aeromonas enteropelogenes]|uniref:Phage shock protein C n=2 Tax=Aeromonas TaxID=642 RepID=A0A175VKQ1_AEREN|nr:envelope stress response membrane protein PspC [Aeromonas enteropelogenes]KXU81211.1 phage shock protein C [Aeromonas enteropelogenes]MBL0457225.1 envelope stress response membrane protein PspC [Aeromonas enteropelogenes]UAK70253.1 envelope stress response membrane protein PspC [Aeromonas enteropelogenes]UBH26040.1 envelope stress response membrane protein PspC [Aeromonas enteropelogenes]UBH51858.1 envelope stress response membrane protein PspC [Aeromonas enteropelogenes]
MNSAYREGRNLYRDPRQGKIAGVCAGLADYFGVETWIVRLLAISGLIFAGFITFTAYMAAWFLLDKKPVTLYEQEEEAFAEVRMKARSWQAGITPHQALGRINRELDALEPRLQQIEKLVTSKEFTLQREFRKL